MVVPQHACAGRRVDHRHATAPASLGLERTAGSPEARVEPVRTRRRRQRGIEQHHAAGFLADLLLHHHVRSKETFMPVDSSPSPLPAPAALCLLRTSAIGDVTHVVPLVRTLQQAWPQTALTWVVGKLERKLVGDVEGVEFVTFDKGAGWAGMRGVWDTLRGRRFDALL